MKEQILSDKNVLWACTWSQCMRGCIRTSSFPSSLCLWECAVQLESEGMECAVDHVTEHIYHLACIWAGLASEHMDKEGESEGRWERGKEGGRNEQERLCKAPGHSVLWHPTPHNGAPLRLQERSLGNTEGKWVSTTLQSHIKFTVMASAGSHAACAWARTSPQIHPNPLFSHTIKGSGLWLYKLIWCKPMSRSQMVVMETLLQGSRHEISEHLLHLDPPATMNYHMYFLADGDFKSV